MFDLKPIIKKVESLAIPPSEKMEIYDQISRDMHEVVWPVLLKYIPDEEINKLNNKPKVNIIELLELVENAVIDKNAISEINEIIDKYLITVNKSLNEVNIQNF